MLYYRWACTHEDDAKSVYFAQAAENHKGFELHDTGLLLSTHRPYVGTSPDGLVNCDCCGKGVLEVKCPFCCREGRSINISVQSMITQHFLKNLRNATGIVSRKISLSGHCIKKAVFAAATSRTR